MAVRLIHLSTAVCTIEDVKITSGSCALAGLSQPGQRLEQIEAVEDVGITSRSCASARLSCHISRQMLEQTKGW